MGKRLPADRAGDGLRVESLSGVGAEWLEALECRIRLVFCRSHSGGSVQGHLLAALTVIAHDDLRER